jgi:hypothetical protein
MSERIEIIRRPGWSSQTTYFARLTCTTTGRVRDCWHSHKTPALAQRCGEKMLADPTDGRRHD